LVANGIAEPGGLIDVTAERQRHAWFVGRIALYRESCARISCHRLSRLTASRSMVAILRYLCHTVARGAAAYERS
jgi:hypothetical protein